MILISTPENSIDLIECLDYIDPAQCDYNTWLSVGMALKFEGYSPVDWDRWSARDPIRYHFGECARKWASFNDSGVTGGTIVALAQEGGWHGTRPDREDRAIGWEDSIGSREDRVVVDPGWIESDEAITEPGVWHPAQELIRYLETLFEAGENVGYVTASWEKDGKYLPQKGSWDRTAGQLIEQLSKCDDDIGAVLGDYNTEAGAWIRFNPLDGNGCKNENVTDFRYALVESDSMELGKQVAMIRQLELPVACLVFSGKKSVHAIVKVEAANYDEYRKRGNYLYDVMQKNGMAIDTQNKNPSRLSRMPGAIRNEHKQFLMDTNFGKASWNEWYDWIEGVNDNLPETENLSSVWDELPELSPPLIDGVLRQGHKMLIAGPSKAGKSFALIELCISIAEGRPWLGFPCAKGKVLYVNLELDRASCLHRFRDVYEALDWEPRNVGSIDIWNLRGKSLPMDKLAPKLIRRAQKRGFLAIIIDPIYKVITGDENSADQMAAFCNQFDLVCTELGCAVIYCHHHSKGSQAGKRSMDRASGSGVFARDPDAMLDMSELEITEDLKAQERQNAAAEAYARVMRAAGADLDEIASQDDLCSERAMKALCREHTPAALKRAELEAAAAKTEADQRSAFRIEGTLREFPKFTPLNVWFRYPVHVFDGSGKLGDLGETNTKGSPWRANFGRKKTNAERAQERKDSLETAYEACSGNGLVKLSDLMEYMGVTSNTVKKRLKEHGGFVLENGIVGRVGKGRIE